MQYTQENLENLSRKEIQSIAKDVGLKCNGKSVDLIKGILESQTAAQMEAVEPPPVIQSASETKSADELESYEIGDLVKLDDESSTIGEIVKINKKSVRIAIRDDRSEMTVKFHEISKIPATNKSDEQSDDMEIETENDEEHEENEMNKSIRKSIETMIPIDICLDADEDEEIENAKAEAADADADADAENGKESFTNSDMRSIIENVKSSLFSPKPIPLSKRKLTSPKRVKTPATAKSVKKSVSIASPLQQSTSTSTRKSVLSRQSNANKVSLSVDATNSTPSIEKKQSLGGAVKISKTPISGKKVAITPKSTKSQMLREEASMRKKRNYEEIQKQAQSEVDDFLQSSGVVIPPSTTTSVASSRVSTAPTPMNVNVSRRGGVKNFVRSRSSCGIRKNSISSISTTTSATKSKSKPKPNFDAIHAKEFSKGKPITNITPRDQQLNDKMTNALKQKLTSSLTNNNDTLKDKAFTTAVTAYNKSNIPGKFVKNKSNDDTAPRKFKAKKMPNFGALHSKWTVKGANTSAASSIKENKPKNLVSGVNTFKF